MGMFDQITCDYPLPDSAVQRELFQTKNLNCLMDQYTITADGRVILGVFAYMQKHPNTVRIALRRLSRKASPIIIHDPVGQREQQGAFQG